MCAAGTSCVQCTNTPLLTQFKVLQFQTYTTLKEKEVIMKKELKFFKHMQ